MPTEYCLKFWTDVSNGHVINSKMKSNNSKKRKERDSIKYVSNCRHIPEVELWPCQVRARLMSFDFEIIFFFFACFCYLIDWIYFNDVWIKSREIVFSLFRCAYRRNETNTNILFEISNTWVRKRISFQSVGNFDLVLWK